jgi:hypothetical protein
MTPSADNCGDSRWAVTAQQGMQMATTATAKEASTTHHEQLLNDEERNRTSRREFGCYPNNNLPKLYVEKQSMTLYYSREVRPNKMPKLHVDTTL